MGIISKWPIPPYIKGVMIFRSRENLENKEKNYHKNESGYDHTLSLNFFRIFSQRILSASLKELMFGPLRQVPPLTYVTVLFQSAGPKKLMFGLVRQVLHIFFSRHCRHSSILPFGSPTGPLSSDPPYPG